MAIDRYLAIQQEHSFKTLGDWTPPFTGWVFFDINSVDMSGPSEQATQYPTAATRDPRFFAPGIYTTSGSFTLPVDATSFGWILKGALGDVESVKIGETDFYTHTFTPATELSSFLVGAGKEAFEHQFKGTLFNELSFSISDRFLVATVGCVGAEDTRADLQTVETDDLPDYVYHTLKSAITTAGDVSAKTMDFSFTLNNNVDIERGIPVNSRFSVRHFAQALNVSGTLTLSFENDDELKEFWGGDTGPHEDTLTETSLEVAFVETAGQKEFTILLPRVIVQSHSAPVSGRDAIEQTMTYLGLVDSSVEAAIEIEMINETAAYPDPSEAT